MEIQSTYYNPSTQRLSPEKGNVSYKEVKVKPVPDPTAQSYVLGVKRKLDSKGTLGLAPTLGVGEFIRGDATKLSGFISSIKKAKY